MHPMPPSTLEEQTRRDLLDCFAAGVKRVSGATAVRRWLEAQQMPRCAVVALGKAAPSMLSGAREVLGDSIDSALMAVDPSYVESVPPGVRWVEGSHPVPDTRSLAAGEAVLTFVDNLPAGLPLLFLISGGTSSMVEALHPGVTLDDLARATSWLLGSGYSIDAMNTVRKAMSRIKGGGLLDFVGDREVVALLISDVPGDDPATVGSGLLVPDPGLRERLAELELPGWLKGLAERGSRAEGPSRTAAVHLVATNRDACVAAAAHAERLGYTAWAHSTFLQGDAGEQGHRLARQLLGGPAGIHVWGGETTVQLPPSPGRGGRNQHLALSAAEIFAGKAGVALLSGGTDGRDGPGEDAGALVDGSTLGRGSLGGLDARRCLAGADSGRFLDAAGDLINTGPTGTNVMDLVIGWKAE
ncbi:MAG: DUF4147 domain-containing protein [Pseudomonadota bacterium]